MHLDTILTELKAERDRINRAIAALEGTAAAANPIPAPAKTRKRGRRKMSAEARNKLSEAKKAWWAMKKKGEGAARRRSVLPQSEMGSPPVKIATTERAHEQRT